MVAGEFSTHHILQDYEARLKDLVERGVVEISPETKFPRFDLMLLGIGHDGHLTSLFLYHPLLEEKKKRVVLIKYSPKHPHVRVTFTFPVINASACVFMVVAGSDEVDAVVTTIKGDSSADLILVQLVHLENARAWITKKNSTPAVDIWQPGVPQIK